MVCLGEWMKRPAWSKWGALLCGSVVTSYSLWQKSVRGLYRPANAKRHPKSPSGADQKWANIWTELSFLGQTFRSLWPFHNSLEIRSTNSDAGRDWGQEEKGMIEDETVGWHHWPNGYGFGWTSGVSDGLGGPACCDSWGRKESDTTEWLNWTEHTRK